MVSFSVPTKDMIKIPCPSYIFWTIKTAAALYPYYIQLMVENAPKMCYPGVLLMLTYWYVEKTLARGGAIFQQYTNSFLSFISVFAFQTIGHLLKRDV